MLCVVRRMCCALNTMRPSVSSCSASLNMYRPAPSSSHVFSAPCCYHTFTSLRLLLVFDLEMCVCVSAAVVRLTWRHAPRRSSAPKHTHTTPSAGHRWRGCRGSLLMVCPSAVTRYIKLMNVCKLVQMSIALLQFVGGATPRTDASVLSVGVHQRWRA